jgi:Flp pilus assembly pilin Flp
MPKIRQFRGERSGAMLEEVALICALLGVASVLGAQLLSTMLQNGEAPAVASAPAVARPAVTAQHAPDERRVGVDMSATGSIAVGARGAVPVSPCEKVGK